MNHNAAVSEFLRITTPLWAEYDKLMREPYTSYERCYAKNQRMNDISAISNALRLRYDKTRHEREAEFAAATELASTPVTRLAAHD